MRRRHILSLLLLAALLLAPFGLRVAGTGRAEDRDRQEAARHFAKLERGMTPEQVRELVGAPDRVARQILYRRYREQWIYNAPLPTRLTFECPRGQKPQLLSLPRLSVEKDHSK
ncbi:MAG TPA: hypothetical protein VMG10_30445 [Gemmataceae bacterium]|nr:hypothetical protein [Gemmataceae bacterium]